MIHPVCGATHRVENRRGHWTEYICTKPEGHADEGHEARTLDETRKVLATWR